VSAAPCTPERSSTIVVSIGSSSFGSVSIVGSVRRAFAISFRKAAAAVH
jgi:hypothetical protein